MKGQLVSYVLVTTFVMFVIVYDILLRFIFLLGGPKVRVFPYVFLICFAKKTVELVHLAWPSWEFPWELPNGISWRPGPMPLEFEKTTYAPKLPIPPDKQAYLPGNSAGAVFAMVK